MPLPQNGEHGCRIIGRVAASSPGLVDGAALVSHEQSSRFWEELDAKLKAHYQELVTCLHQELAEIKDSLVTELSSSWLGRLDEVEDNITKKVEDTGADASWDPYKIGRTSLNSDSQESEADRVRLEAIATKRVSVNSVDIEAHYDNLKENAFAIGLRKERRTERTRTERVIESHTFEVSFTMAIFANAMLIGIQTNLAANGTGEDHLALFLLNLFFTVLFAVELIIRLRIEKLRFFWGSSNLYWNYLDFIVVSCSVLEAILDVVTRGGAQDASQFRILRILRITRLVRGLRITRVVRFVRALRTLVHQILFTVKSMVWAFILLAMILYLFAIVFTQGATSARMERGDDLHADLECSDDALICYWGTLPRSLQTLFKVITGGTDWGFAAVPLEDVGWVWLVLFMAYISFMQMAVLNVITGFFCQNAIEAAKYDHDLVTQSILAQNRMYLEQINTLFSAMDTDESGSITIQEFEEHLGSDTTKAYFESLGLDASDVWTLFKLMDMDNGCQIELEEFITGCMRLKGGAKGLDVAKLAYEHKYLAKQMCRFMSRTDNALSMITGSATRKSSYSMPMPRRPSVRIPGT